MERGGKGKREEGREGRGGSGKGRAGGAFWQIKIYDYTPENTDTDVKYRHRPMTNLKSPLRGVTVRYPDDEALEGCKGVAGGTDRRILF